MFCCDRHLLQTQAVLSDRLRKLGLHSLNNPLSVYRENLPVRMQRLCSEIVHGAASMLDLCKVKINASTNGSQCQPEHEQDPERNTYIGDIKANFQDTDGKIPK